MKIVTRASEQVKSELVQRFSTTLDTLFQLPRGERPFRCVSPWQTWMRSWRWKSWLVVKVRVCSTGICA